ncbi:MAG: MFS transporter [Myxococcales bacterium]|nr:MFS transporter [Myxococcales bacterium]
MLAIFLVVLVDVFGMTLVIPLLGPYAERYHASPLQATLLVSVYAACMLVSGPILGALSDRYGRKRLLLVSQLGTLIGFVMLARAQSLAMIFVARAIDGATAGNLSLAQAYVSDRTKPEDRTSAFALIGIAFGVGFFIGPWITGLLVRSSFTAPIWLAAGLSLTSIVCTLLLLEGGLPPQRATGDGPGGRRLSLLSWGSYAPFFRRPILGGVLLEHLVYSFAFTSFTSGFALFAERTYRHNGQLFTPREVGYAFAYAGFLGIVLQGGMLKRLTKRYGEGRLIRAGFLSNALGYAVMALVPTTWGLALATTITAFGNGTLRPSLSGLASQHAEPHEQGVVLGLVQSLSSVAAIAAPFASGLLLEHRQLIVWAALPGAIALVGVALGRRGSALTIRDSSG